MNIPFSFGAGTGVDIVDSNGNVVNTADNIPCNSGGTYYPASGTQTIASGVYLTGNIVIAGDADLIASNIRSGIKLWNVTGTLVDRYSSRILNPWDAYC